MIHFKNMSLERKMLLFFSLTCIFLLFFAPDAMAGVGDTNFNTNMFDISDADVSKKKFLDIYFPENDMSTSPLSAAIGAFNSVVLLVGGILVAYTIIAGTMSTAHDGDVLGKKWSSMWIPIRFSVGAALLVPSSGGFCAIQMFMLWVVQMSIGAASHVWVSYVENMGVANGVIIPNMSNEKLARVAKSAFLSNLCVLKTNAINKELNKNIVLKAEMGSDNGGTIIRVPPNHNTIAISNHYRSGFNIKVKSLSFKSFNYGSDNLPGITGSGDSIANSVNIQNNFYALGRDKRACGAFLIPDELPDIEDRLQNFKDLSVLLKNVVKGQPIYFMDLQNEMKALAQQYMNSNGSINLSEAFDKSIAKYKEKVAERVAQLFKEDKGWNAYTEAVKKDGWLIAGSWSIRLVQVQEILGQLTNIYPTFFPPAVSYKDLTSDTQLEDFMNKAGRDIAASEAASSYMTGLATVGANKNKSSSEDDKKIDPEEKSKSLDGLFGGINKKSQEIFSFSSGINLQAAVEAGEEGAGVTNPLTIAKFYGDTAIEFGWSILAIAAVAGAVAGALPWSGGWFLTITGAASLVTPISITLWIAGNSLSVLLPLTPYMLWLGMIGGWMILVLEAMVSAPLWIVTQLQPDADGIAGKGSTGYGLVLSLALRPTLMIIGLICAIEMLNILGGILSITFVSMISASGLGAGNVIKTIGLLFVYFGILYSIVNRSFSLIHVIPDEVMKWLNVHGGQSLASYAKESQGTTMGKAAMTKVALDQASSVGGKATGSIANSAQKGVKYAKGKMQDRKLNNSLKGFGGGAGDFSKDAQGLASQANTKYEQSQMFSAKGDSTNAGNYMQQAQDLASHIPADQALGSGLNPALLGYAGTAPGVNAAGQTDQQISGSQGQGDSSKDPVN